MDEERAGEAGETRVREFLRDRSRGYQPVGFIDDDLEKKDREIHGVRVVLITGAARGLGREYAVRFAGLTIMVDGGTVFL